MEYPVLAEGVSNNEPQFSAKVFAEFTKSYGIIHQTSSPRYLESNGEAEQAVKTVKFILNKSKDPYWGLLAYCTIAIHNGYSLSQLLMGQTLSSTTLQLQTHFVPQLQNQCKLQRGSRKPNIRRTTLTTSINKKQLNLSRKERRYGCPIERKVEQLEEGSSKIKEQKVFNSTVSDCTYSD